MYVHKYFTNNLRFQKLKQRRIKTENNSGINNTAVMRDTETAATTTTLMHLMK